jgi:hypothetical protein
MYTFLVHIKHTDVDGHVLLIMENFRFPFSFAANKRKFAVSVFRLQQTNGNCRFQLVPFSICSGVSKTRIWTRA